MDYSKYSLTYISLLYIDLIILLDAITFDLVNKIFGKSIYFKMPS